jgi:hypothetical protein
MINVKRAQPKGANARAHAENAARLREAVDQLAAERRADPKAYAEWQARVAEEQERERPRSEG